MLHATLRRTPLSASAAFFAGSSRPHPSTTTRPLSQAAASRRPSDALALSLFLCCAPCSHPPPSSFHRLLPAATRLASRLRTAPAILHHLRSLGCPIRPRTFLLLLTLYWRAGRALYPLVLQLFDQMPLWGFRPNTFARNVALDVLLRTARFDDALRALNDNPSPNYLTHAIVLLHLCRAAHWPGVRRCFMAMLAQGYLPSATNLASVFACCSKAGTMLDLLQLLSFAIVSGHHITSFMWTCFIARMCRDGRIDDACTLLAKMLRSGSSPTVVTYTPIIKGLFRAGRRDEVTQILELMTSTGCSPDLVLYNVVMDCMVKEGAYDAALGVYLDLNGGHVKPDAYTLSTLAQVLQFSHNKDHLLSLILGSDISYDLVACNSVLSALCKAGFPSEAVKFFNDMINLRGIRPDGYSHVALLDSLFQLGLSDHKIIACYRCIIVNNPDSDAYIHATILRGLIRRGQNHMALHIFREAVRQNYALDPVCYTIVLQALFQAHYVGEACELFDRMKLAGMVSSTCIYNVMLRGLCRTRDMCAITQLLREMESAGVQMDSISFNIMAVLLIKLQCISSATALVSEMLNLGMKLSTKTSQLLSRSIGHPFIVEDDTIAESDRSDSTSDLMVGSAL